MSIKDLSLSELLDLAEKGIEGKLDANDKILLDKSSVGRYVKERGLIESEDRVPTYIIYHDYCQNWQSRGKKDSKHEFFRKFNKYFNQHRTKNQRYYKVQCEHYDLTEEGLKKAKQYDKRREAQTITAKKRKVSSTKKEIQSEKTE